MEEVQGIVMASTAVDSRLPRIERGSTVQGLERIMHCLLVYQNSLQEEKEYGTHKQSPPGFTTTHLLFR